ncbi:MAG: hypothetical protein FJ020_06170 [Chloroflexi bacterium]|nr:hypothetical protein [Chloroflexota bacterium]
MRSRLGRPRRWRWWLRTPECRRPTPISNRCSATGRPRSSSVIRMWL